MISYTYIGTIRFYSIYNRGLRAWIYQYIGVYIYTVYLKVGIHTTYRVYMRARAVIIK